MAMRTMKRLAALACFALLCAPGVGTADIIGVEDLGLVSLGDPVMTIGSIDDPQEADFYAFTLDSFVAVSIDIDMADDAAGTGDNDEGLDSSLWLFDSSERLIAFGLDIGFPTDPGSDPYGDLDAYIGPLLLGPGTYFVAVTSWSNDALALEQFQLEFEDLAVGGVAVFGALPDARLETDDGNTTGSYQLLVSARAAPEPATWLVLSLGLLGVGVSRHRR